MCAREERGIMIAAIAKIIQKGKAWIVPSQTGNGKYTVIPDEQQPFCSCPDHESHGGMCKHLFAVRLVIKREQHTDGSETITETRTITETVERKTYSQDWPAYNAAQVNEKKYFQILLRDLCAGVTDQLFVSKGRQPIPVADALFAAIFKVYSTVSARRFMCDLSDAHEKGFIGKLPCYNTIFNYLENPDLTPILMDLIVKSSLPLKAIETDFAVDSSGFTSSKFTRWFDVKYGETGKFCEEHTWVKAHICCGVKTHVVTACEIYEKNTNDSPIMPSLLATTKQNFDIREVSADKQYASQSNFTAIDALGADAFIKFRAGTTGGSGGLFGKAFGFFCMYREEFLQSYHKRSNVESAFSMIKRKFGDSVRSRTDVAMKNEVLAKMICHNIACCISAMFELGVVPQFLNA